MPKKFFDIIPPHLASDFGKKVKKIIGEDNKKRRYRKGGGKMSFRLKGTLISAGILFVLLLIYLYFTLPSASVEIWPKTQQVSFEQDITAEGESIDLQNNKIPVQLVEEEKELWQEFPATGSSSKEGMAEGTIRVYNKYSPATALNLKAKTRFLSDSGKYFRSVDKINLPPAQIKNGKITPSYVDVEVTAIESGETYNIGPSKFSVPGLAGTAFYYSVYGESTSDMTGGFESKLKVATAEDIEDAENSLSQKLFTDAEDALKNRISSSGLILFNDAITRETLEKSCAVKAGAEVERFNCGVKVKVSGLAFKEEYLKDFARSYILSQTPTPGEKTVLEKSLVTEYSPKIIDLKAGKITIGLKMSAEIYPLVDENKMSLSFMGESSDYISNIIYNTFNQEVSRFKVNFWPFWVKKAPKNQDKIKIELKFE